MKLERKETTAITRNTTKAVSYTHLDVYKRQVVMYLPRYIILFPEYP